MTPECGFVAGARTTQKLHRVLASRKDSPTGSLISRSTTETAKGAPRSTRSPSAVPRASFSPRGFDLRRVRARAASERSARIDAPSGAPLPNVHRLELLVRSPGGALVGPGRKVFCYSRLSLSLYLRLSHSLSLSLIHPLAVCCLYVCRGGQDRMDRS